MIILPSIVSFNTTTAVTPKASPIAPTGCLSSSKFRCSYCSTVHPCLSQIIGSSSCLTIDILAPWSISAPVLTPSTSVTTLYVGPHLGKVPVADWIFSSFVNTVTIHVFGFSSVATFCSPDSITLDLADSPALFSFLCEGSRQLIAK